MFRLSHRKQHFSILSPCCPVPVRELVLASSGCITYKVYPSPSSDKFTTYPKYLLHKICENVESLAKSDELSKSNFLKGIQEVKKEGEERRGLCLYTHY